MKLINKILCLMTILVLTFNSAGIVFAQEQESKKIKEIRISGAQNFKERTVRDLIKTRVRDFNYEQALRQDVEFILASGNYDEVSYETQDLGDSVRVVFKVKERPMVKKIDFSGNKKLSKSKLRTEISLKTKEGFEQLKLDADVQKILQLYSEKGYPDAKIEPFTVFDDIRNQVNINFVINEGRYVRIEKIEFKGNESFKSSKLRRLMKTKVKKVFDFEKLKNDREFLKGFYQNQGYAKAEIGEPEIQYNQDRTLITIVVPVTEGKRYVVGGVNFSGNTVQPEEKLKKAVELRIGKLYKQDKFDETLRNLRELYFEDGYLYVQIEPEETIDQDKGQIIYQFKIQEGNVVYIDRVFVEGFQKTKEKVFTREILLKSGDPFSSSKLRRSQERIFNLGFIRDVKPDIQPSTKDSSKADLVMTIEEDRPGSLSAGAGYSSTDGLVGQVQLAHSNLFGLAQRLSLLWEFGARRQNYEISWTEPWMLNRPVSFGFDAFNTERERLFDGDSSTDYTEVRRGGSIRIGPRFSDIYALNFSYTINNIDIKDVRVSLKDQIKEELTVNSSFSTELVRDTRDYFFDASHGSRNSIFTQVSGGPIFRGDTHLVKAILSTSWFWTMFEIGNYPFVFSLNGRFGAVQEYGDSDTVPLFERFFVGGADSVRGYQTRGEIGPTEGGRTFTVINAEYKIPLYAEGKRRILQLVLFADMGGAWRKVGDIRGEFNSSPVNSTNENYLKSSVGVGLRITTPVFPIRLDWGYGLNHRDGEDLSQIHFTLGNLF